MEEKKHPSKTNLLLFRRNLYSDINTNRIVSVISHITLSKPEKKIYRENILASKIKEYTLKEFE